MLDGYIIVSLNPDNTVNQYWDGTIFQDEIDAADFITTVDAARFAQGSIQAQNVNFDVVYRKAKQNIELAP
ncbi:MAG TPA: hypothetical protein VK203_28425 [Nostocaceae cyanobacterium]|nr:hypothetical protein [Nostocaceae cyanobacterium]